MKPQDQILARAQVHAEYENGPYIDLADLLQPGPNETQKSSGRPPNAEKRRPRAINSGYDNIRKKGQYLGIKRDVISNKSVAYSNKATAQGRKEKPRKR